MTTESLPTIHELNESDYDVFLSTLRRLFEGEVLGPDLYERRPYDSYESLVTGAEKAAGELGEVDKIRLINSHPRLGESAEALKRLSLQSLIEQGLDREEAEDERRARQQMWEQNLVYEEKFGFRFVVFVNRRPPTELLSILEQRITRDRGAEIKEAVKSVFLIARDRLSTILADSG